jgi:hypothetical protein
MRNFEVINESDCTHEWSQKRRRGFEQKEAKETKVWGNGGFGVLFTE